MIASLEDIAEKPPSPQYSLQSSLFSLHCSLELTELENEYGLNLFLSPENKYHSVTLCYHKHPLLLNQHQYLLPLFDILSHKQRGKVKLSHYDSYGSLYYLLTLSLKIVSPRQASGN